nr:hypothetical protein [Prosthecochloris sp. GSB1]
MVFQCYRVPDDPAKSLQLKIFIDLALHIGVSGLDPEKKAVTAGLFHNPKKLLIDGIKPRAATPAEAVDIEIREFLADFNNDALFGRKIVMRQLEGLEFVPGVERGDLPGDPLGLLCPESPEKKTVCRTKTAIKRAPPSCIYRHLIIAPVIPDCLLQRPEIVIQFW